MQTTGIFTTFTHKVRGKIGEPIYLVPFGDVHYDSPLCARDKFDAFIKEWSQKINKGYNVVMVGMGDYMDYSSTSERRILENPNIHESTRENLNQWAIDGSDTFIEKIKPISKKMIGMIEGNHYADLTGGITTTQYMCSKIGAKYMGVLSLFRLSIDVDGGGYSADVYAHHGKGGGRLVGGNLNKIQQMAEGCRADIFLQGHTHALVTGKSSSIEMDRKGRIVDRTQVYARTGSFLKAFEDGKASYIADACMNPCELGSPYVTITPMRDKSKGGRGRYLDIRTTI